MKEYFFSYNDRFYDGFGRLFEYSVENVPYLEDGDKHVLSGFVLNRIIELRNNLREVVEKMNTERRHWFIKIDYDSGRTQIVNDR